MINRNIIQKTLSTVINGIIAKYGSMAYYTDIDMDGIAVKAGHREELDEPSRFLIEDVVETIRTLVVSITDEPPEEVVGSVVFVFNSLTDIEVVVDVRKDFRALYFGREFVNQKVVKQLIMNVTAKYSKIYQRQYAINLYNIEN